MRKLATALVALSILLLPGGAAADDFDQSNSNTGALSENHNDVSINNNVNASFSNTSNVTISVNQTANSGGNNVNMNTNVGNLSTGDAVGSADVSVDVDQQGPDAATLAALADPHFGGGSQSNSNTGFNSNQTNQLAITNNVDIDVSNETNVDVQQRCEASSGGNNVEKNTNAGNVSTGSAKCLAKVDIDIAQGGVGGAEPGEEEEGAEIGEGGEEEEGPLAAIAAAAVAAVGGAEALFPAGESLLILFLGLLLAANLAYLWSRRHLFFAIHFLNEGKVRRGRKH